MENWQSIFSQVERLKRDVEMKLQLFELYYEKQMTLQQIGDRFGVTRERIRRIMERLAIPRYRNRGGVGSKSKFKTISEYFKHVKDGGQESRQILLKFVAPLKKHCEECGSTRKLAIHHLKYPATSLNDIRILCYLCHYAKHGKRGLIFQRKMCNEYLNGQETLDLAKQYRVSRVLIYKILSKWNIGKRYDYGKLKGTGIRSEICNKYRAGKSAVELAREYGVSCTPIYRILHQHNVEMKGYANACP